MGVSGRVCVRKRKRFLSAESDRDETQLNTVYNNYSQEI